MTSEPLVFNVFREEAERVTQTPYGSVGQLFSGEGVEAVWVAKRDEEIDPGWFSQDCVDLILVVQGELRFEFERADLEPRVLGPGDFMILPANTRCRAYRWPRERKEASAFVAVYPRKAASSGNDPRHFPHFAGVVERLESTPSWEDLTLPESDRRRLREIATRVRHRATMVASFEGSAETSPGKAVTALFVGPDGMGKAMAAAAVTSDLNLALHRVDLRRIVSKYLGETERNLKRVFAEAQRSHAVLFFDEAEALFGKRQEVQDSHDRYANLGLAYLLQRMEAYPGLVILATNLRSALDEAFLRRVDCIIEFPGSTAPPNVAEEGSAGRDNA